MQPHSEVSSSQHVLVLTQYDVAVPTYGGALRVAGLIPFMRAQGVAVSVIRFRASHERPSPAGSGVHDLVVPRLYSLASVAAAWQFWRRDATHIARKINAAHPVTIVQSDPPWSSLAAQRIARTLDVPHVVLSQNCETALAMQFSRNGPARKVPVIGSAIARCNLAVLRGAEKRAIEGASLAFTPSEHDLEEMRSVGIDTGRVKVLPNGTTVRYLPEQARSAVRARLGIAPDEPMIIFLGRMDYPPNLQAVHTIRERIAPHCPGARFILVGSNPPHVDLPQNVQMVGRVDSVDEYLRASDLAVVPIEQGSGTRIKILDSWAAGLAVLSTRAGASGIGYRHMENIIIEDDIASYSACINKLVADRDLLRRIGAAALASVEPYRWDNIAPAYLNAITGLTHQWPGRTPVVEMA